MKGIYGSRMMESHEKKQDVLGIDLYSSVDEEVRVKMMDYLRNIVSDFTETIQGRVSNPASEHLLTVSEDASRNFLMNIGPLHSTT